MLIFKPGTYRPLPGGLSFEPKFDSADEARAHQERYDLNWAWYVAHVEEIIDAHVDKQVCIAGQEAFAADTFEDAVALAKAVHPDDTGWFVCRIDEDVKRQLDAYRRAKALRER